MMLIVFGTVTISLTPACSPEEEEPEEETPGGDDDDGGGGGLSAPNGGSILFDGSAEYLTMPTGWLTGDFTICLWMKPSVVDNSGSSGHTLLSLSAGDKYGYLSFDNNELDWKIECNNDTDMVIDGTTTFAAGNWYQVCVTTDYGGTGSRAYLNGAHVGTSGVALSATPAAAHT